MATVGHKWKISEIQKIFQKFDETSTGAVALPRVPALLAQLGRSGGVVNQVVDALGASHGTEEDAPLIPFEEVVAALKEAEKETANERREEQAAIAAQTAEQKPTETVTPLILLVRLDEYRKECEQNGQYAEARAAKEKLGALRDEEERRQKQLVLDAQKRELNEVEQAQKRQFLEFSAAWDKYMSDYESSAFMSLERLKESHAQQLQELRERFVGHGSGKQMKASRELMELRSREQALAKLARYEEAFAIKRQADALEKQEVERNQHATNEVLEKHEKRLKSLQDKALQALLKRIQRDRGEQVRQRAADSQRLLLRNKTLKAHLMKKQSLEFQRASDAIKVILANPSSAQRALEASSEQENQA